MKRTALILFFILIAAAISSAETLGEASERALSELRSARSALQQPAASETGSEWAQSTALADLDQLSNRTEALLEQLGGERNAAVLEEPTVELKAAIRRARTSSVLLPPAALAPFERAQRELEDVLSRLDELRTRFGGHATVVELPLEGVDLVRSDEGLLGYQNLEALLIDARELYRLASSLRVGGFPQQGVGFRQPNNLDGLQVRRFALASNALVRDLSARPDDITEVLPRWERVQTEYLRLGYPGDDEVVRRLTRVVDRLQSFFRAVAQPDS